MDHNPEPDMSVYDVLSNTSNLAFRIDMLASQLCAAVDSEAPVVREHYTPDTLVPLAQSVFERLSHIEELLQYRVANRLGFPGRDVPTDPGPARAVSSLAARVG